MLGGRFAPSQHSPKLLDRSHVGNHYKWEVRYGEDSGLGH